MRDDRGIDDDGMLKILDIRYQTSDFRY